jgi:hypothetical protein
LRGDPAAPQRMIDEAGVGGVGATGADHQDDEDDEDEADAGWEVVGSLPCGTAANHVRVCAQTRWKSARESWPSSGHGLPA